MFAPPALPEARKYLERVLPWPEADEPGFINVHYRRKLDGGKLHMNGTPVRTVDAAINAIQRQLNDPKTTDIYVCMSLQRECAERAGPNGQFKIAVRSADNALKLKSLFLDIDAKDYTSGHEAYAAFKQWLKDSNMPEPSVIVFSGGGLHVYWVMHRALTVDEWSVLAHDLVEATKRCGLKCDTGVTTDAARILRVPQTWNYKQEERRPVTMVWHS